MPIYDYDCAACGRRIEVVHGVYAPGPTHCPNCGGGPLRKAIAAPAVHFKGTGWAKRDRRTAVTSGTSRGSSDAPAVTGGETKDGGEVKDGRGAPGESGSAAAAGATDGAATGGGEGVREPAAASSKKPGARAAAKPD